MDSKLNRIKQISIKEFLSSRGVQPATDKGYYGLYHSPVREDSTPSFKVDFRQNLWCDYGTGEGGTIVDLVMALEKCSVLEAIRMLEDGYNTAIKIPVFDRSKPDGSALEITDIVRLAHPALVRYLESRGISHELARLHCMEVHYKRGEKSYFAIGFPNNSDGWEFRNPHFKGSFSPKDITTVAIGSDSVLVFEGFMDYLSFLSLERVLTPAADVLVLNSVANLKRAIPFLRQHSTIYTYLDNDEAGRRCAKEIGRSLPDARQVDCSGKYAGYKDLNDFLMATR